MEKLIAWVEIPTENFERALTFYNSVFDFDLQTIDCGGESKMACFPGGEGAVIYEPGYKPSQNGVVVSLNTGNKLDQVMQKISMNGGKILRPKTKIEVEGRGYFSVCLDCEGNRIGLYGDN